MAEYKYLLGNVKGKDGTNGTNGTNGRGIKDISKTGETLTVTLDDNTKKTFSVPNGTAGAAGANGRGIKSIDIEATDATGKTTITITLDDNTKKTFSVFNGKNGKDGATGSKGATGEKGADGKDGVGIKSITQTEASDTDGGANVCVFELSDGRKSSFVVRNGATAGADAMKKSVIENASAGTYNGTTIANYLETLNEDIAKEIEERIRAITSEEDKRKAKDDEIIELVAALQQSSNDSVAGSLEKVNEALEAEIAERSAADEAEVTARNEAISQSADVIGAKIDAEKTRAESAEKSLQGNIDKENERSLAAEVTLQAQIDVLNADEATTGSVKKSVTDAIAALIANAPESLDTLKEIADWISGHTEDAAAMNSAITANRDAIAKERADREAALKDATDKESAARLAAINEISKQLNESTDESADLDFSTTDFQM